MICPNCGREMIEEDCLNCKSMYSEADLQTLKDKLAEVTKETIDLINYEGTEQ